MIKRSSISYLLLFLIPTIGATQNQLKSGVLTNFKTKITLPKDWRIETKIENRQILLENNLTREIATTYRYERTDIGAIGLKKKGNSTFGLGYMIRLSTSLLIQRFSLLYSLKKNLPFAQMKHRFLADQTFSPMESPKYRFRYRFDFRPIFFKEKNSSSRFFFKSNQELLFLIKKDTPIGLEFRFMPIISFVASENSTIELGIDSRIGEIRINPLKSQFWLYFGYIIRF